MKEHKPHLISLLDQLLHALNSIEHLLGNCRAMRYICLFCTWPVKFEEGAKLRLVSRIEWLKTSKITWMSLSQVWWAVQRSPPHHM
jgi:hypothetical protein